MKIREKIISIIRFVDDIVIVSESEGDMQQAINKIEETLRTFKMKINENKIDIGSMSGNLKI